ncbi:hypothetical protein NP493_776g01006 [Ridgeia piscesae]|uniref:VWFC domain-containing protein n=1 Tax=Ridgeia piscesae TaxID=27915 RepID=A0AAD9KNY6_RIDPI|nr:hypothetical protein NP493_776g01006 [Ridgeia piscesae]
MAWTMSTLTLLVVACAVVLVGCHGPKAKTARNGRTLCVYEKKVYRPGRRFKPNACTTCHCPKRGGRTRCSIEDCREQPNCLQFAKSPKCCPACLRYGCLHSDGKVYQPGTVVSVNQCSKCVCPTTGGRTICTNVPCPRLHCVDAVADPGQCCRKCINVTMCQWKRVSDNVSVTTCQWQCVSDNVSVTTCQGQRVSDNVSVTTCQ